MRQGTSIPGVRVVRELHMLVRLHGKPACIATDNGTAFTSRAILQGASKTKGEWHAIDPAKPQQNAVIASFNGSQVAVQHHCRGSDLGLSRHLPLSVTRPAYSALACRCPMGR